jgi:signal transduction histidine kinase
MPITRSAFLRSSAVFLVVAFVALLAIVGTTFFLAERSQAISDHLTDWRVARATTVNLRNVLQMAEQSQRGYLLTSDDDYLEPYSAHSEQIVPLYGRMIAAVEPLLGNTADLARFETAVEDKVGEMSRTIELARAGQVDEAVAMVRTNRGKELMDDLQTFFSQTIASADEQIIQGLADQDRNFLFLRLVTGIGGVVILLVIGGAVWTALSYTREIIAARAEVEDLNVGLEGRIQERTKDLIRANEEVQRFAYIVTHDLRAPLVNIMGFTSELDTTLKSIQAYLLAEPGKATEDTAREAKLAASEDLPEAIGFIRSSTRKMDGLINAILKISREGRRPLKPEVIDLKPMLENSVATIQHQIADNGGEAEITVSVPRIVSDRMALEQIVGNLLDNAVKYRSAERPLRLQVTAQRMPGNRVTIAVADNGRGIAQHDHERVFDLFRRAGVQDKPGEGIGLAHVRTQTRNLGGDITVTSTYGEGSTFTVDLPLDLRSFVRSDNQ